MLLHTMFDKEGYSHCCSKSTLSDILHAVKIIEAEERWLKDIGKN